MIIQIRSTDPWLLARLITDLQLEGFNYAKDWHKNISPFSGWKRMAVFTAAKTFRCRKSFYFLGYPEQQIAEANYLEILETILSPESPVRG